MNKYLLQNKKCRLIRCLCISLALLLCSCSNHMNGTDGALSDGNRNSGAVSGISVKESIMDYTVVFPDEATDAERKAMQMLISALGDNAKSPKSDFVIRGQEIPHNNREILLGRTNRFSSKAAVDALEGERDYTISFGEDEVIIAAKNDKAILDAIRYFIDDVLPAPISDYSQGYEYSFHYEYPFKSFFGLNLSYMKISYTDSELKNAADMLGEYILDMTGEKAINEESETGNIRLEIDIDMNDNDYEVNVGDGVVVVRAVSRMAVEEAVRVIVQSEMGGKALSFAGSSSIPLTMNSIRDDRKMVMVWNDEFDGDELDSSVWQLYDRMWNPTVKTTEDEKNICMEDGEIVMRTYREEDDTFTTHKTLTTWNRMSFLYGYLEIYAKIPHDNGAWPGFWLQSVPQHREAEYMTEIDIFELYKSGYMEGTMHKWYLDPTTGGAVAHDWNDPKIYNFAGTDDFKNEYHLYGFGWTPTEIYFTVDGEIFGVYDITDSGDFGKGLGNPGDKGELTGMDGFQDPVAINFTNWVNQSGSYKNSWTVNESSEFPFVFSIDWIRLYQVPGEGVVYNDYN
ncbi:MAG: family 16 glycosylhydrolase [Eubacteriales bacterium]